MKNIKEIKKVSVEKLFSGGRRFDLFEYSESDIDGAEKLVRENLYPLPVVCGNEAVWGFCVLRAAEKTGIKDVFCRILEDPRSAAMLKAVLLCEGRRDRYTWGEKEKIYNFIRENRINTEDQELADLIQSSGGFSFIQAVSAYTGLPAELKNYTASGLLDLKTAVSCSNVGDPVLKHGREYFEKLSFSKRRIMLINISEILKRSGLSGSEGAEYIIRLLNNNDDDPFSAAEEIRYPELKSTQKYFDDYKNSQLKGSGIRLDPPPYFEGEGYKVEFTFRSGAALKKIIDRLEKVKESSDDLFRLL